MWKKKEQPVVIEFPTGTRVKVKKDAETDFQGCQGQEGEVVQITGFGSVKAFAYLYDQPYEVRFDEPIECSVPYDDGSETGTTVKIEMNKIWFNSSDLEAIPMENSGQTPISAINSET